MIKGFHRQNVFTGRFLYSFFWNDGSHSYSILVLHFSICATCQRSMRTLLRSALRGRSLTLVRGCLPDCECKGTATFRTDQIFSQLFLIFLHFYCFLGCLGKLGRLFWAEMGCTTHRHACRRRLRRAPSQEGEKVIRATYILIYTRARRDNDETKQADGTTLNTHKLKPESHLRECNVKVYSL